MGLRASLAFRDPAAKSPFQAPKTPHPDPIFRKWEWDQEAQPTCFLPAALPEQ